MGLTVNLRHLEARNLRLEGELPVEELDIDTRDEVIQLEGPLRYDLEVQKLDSSLLVQGQLGMTLSCQCVRCLKPFQHRLELRDWTIDVPLQGDEAVPVINDCVDLTPLLREDILLEFPQHPLCQAECRGLLDPTVGKAKNKTGGTGKSETEAGSSSTWAELNKLKF